MKTSTWFKVAAATVALSTASAAGASEWKVLIENSSTSVLVDVEKEKVGYERVIKVWIIFKQPREDGSDNVRHALAIDCDARTVLDRGGVSFKGVGEKVGDVPSETGGKAIKHDGNAIFESVAEYACMGTTRSQVRRVFPNDDKAFAYGKK